MTLAAGSRLGHYEILSHIGAGGMGEVYRARDPKLGRDVAIKVLPEDVARDPDRLARFEREARSLAALNHPGIVTIFAVEEAEGARFLAMELVEGDGLDTLVPPGGLPLSPFLDIAVPLAEALSAAHERGIVHRDLKPGNVMVTREGRVKVLDFGLARVEAGDPNADLTSTPTESRVTNLTSEGQVFGTVAYMSPEQARGAKVDARSDVFSLGIVMYQMLTGERPFHGSTSVDLISSILRDRPASVTDLRADLPPDLARVVRRCLEKEPRDRYQTSRDVYNELRELRADSAAAAPTAVRPRSEVVSPARSDPSSARTQAFWIAVLPFTHSGGDPELASFAEGLAEDIHAGLAKFPYLSVISRNSTFRFQAQTSDVRTLGRQLGARYLLEGGIRTGGSVLRVHVQLVDAETGAHLWAETYNRDRKGTDVLAVQDDVTDRVVATVADTSGALVRSMAASVEEKPDAELTATDVVLRHWRYQHRGTPAEHARVRDGLEKFVEREPGHADVWACVARLYVHEFALGYNRRPDPLGRALRAAQRAVDLDPTCQHARAGIAQVHFFRREVPAFRAAAEQAIALNPRDTDTLGVMGNMLADSGDFERGPKLVRRAMELNPHFPDWFRFALTVDHFQKADYAGALDELARVNMPGFFWKELWIAACAGLAGRRAEAAAAVDELRRLDPGIERQAREFMDSWLYASGLTERFVEGLRKAGLDVPAEGEPVSTTGERPASSPPVSGAGRADDGFWIAVLPFEHTGGSSELSALAEGMTDAIVTGLSRFSYLRVVSRGSTQRFASEETDVRTVGKELGARYVLNGSLRQAGSALRISVQLVDAQSGAHLWAETYDRTLRPEAAFELQDDVVPRIVSTVADTHGILPHSMSEGLRGRSPETLTPYEAVLRGLAQVMSVSAEHHASVRAGLERAVQEAPGYADAWALLSNMYREEYAHGFNPRPDPLGRSLAAARRAVEIAPSNHLAHHSLATALFLRREFPAFRSAAERATALNPMDGFTMAYLASLIAYSGDWERGCAMAKQARDLNPRHPGWYWFSDCFDAYRRGDFRGARDIARKIQMPGFWRLNLALAAAHGQLGEGDAAAGALRELLAARPVFASQPREELAKWWNADFVESLMDGLHKAGLDVSAQARDASPSPAPREFTAGGRPRRRWGRIAATASAVLLLAVAAVWIARSRPAAPRPTAAGTVPAIRSLAVLPLDNYSGDPSQDYFAEGMTDELTSQLANLSRLRVISRGSTMQFAGKNRPPTPEIAKRLDVDAVVEGSVIRSGDKVRITAQLIDARSDRHLWAKSFERRSKDVLALQDELASAIAHEIHVELTPAESSRLAKGRSVNPEAYDAYLKGRYFFNRPDDENLKKAIEKFEEATRLDPTFAPAFSGLSDAYAWAGFNEGVLTASEARPKAQAAAEKAIALDDDSAEAHTSLANFKLWYEYDWPGSETEFRRAFTLNPNYAFAHDQFGVGLAFHGRFDEAIAEGRRAAALDPLSPSIPLDSTTALGFKGDYDAARTLARRGADLDPTGSFAPFVEGWLEIQAGRLPEAIAAFRKAKAMDSPPYVTAYLAYAYGASGDRTRALAELEDLKKRSRRGVVSPYNMALVSLGLGDRAHALDSLEKAYASDSEWLGYLNLDKIFDSLRSEPRFQALLKKLGFAG